MPKLTVCFPHGDALDLFRGDNGDRFGGAETQVYLMSKLLADDPGFDVRLVADRPVSDVTYDGITFMSHKPPVARGLPYVSRVVNRARAARPYRGLRDAVLIQTIAGAKAIDVWRVARRFGLKFVLRMSCDADIDGSLLYPHMVATYFEALRDADGVIAQTPSQQASLLERHGIEATLVPSLVQVPPQMPSQHGTGIMWVGRGAPIKRPWIAVETARVMPQYKFTMIMPVEDPLFWRWVTQEAERIPNLTVIPGVPYFEMEKHFRNSAILLGTSAIEGFPNVYLQAAAQGTPVVSLDVPASGLCEIDVMGVYAHGDVGRMREMIDELMSNPAELERLGLSAFDYVVHHHTADAVAPTLKAFLRRVAAK